VIGEEQAKRVQRAARGQAREGGGGVMLAQVRDVRERGRNRRQDQPDRYLKIHACSQR
jgi:hypothetical protein